MEMSSSILHKLFNDVMNAITTIGYDHCYYILKFCSILLNITESSVFVGC